MKFCQLFQKLLGEKTHGRDDNINLSLLTKIKESGLKTKNLRLEGAP
jgi:hypothetical protein